MVRKKGGEDGVTLAFKQIYTISYSKSFCCDNKQEAIGMKSAMTT